MPVAALNPREVNVQGVPSAVPEEEAPCAGNNPMRKDVRGWEEWL